LRTLTSRFTSGLRKHGNNTEMKIGITGATGLIGSALGKLAHEGGHEVVGFSRSRKSDRPWVKEWRSFGPQLDTRGCDALVHLAGESLMGLWTEAKKRRIWESRVDVTRTLVAGLEKSKDRPQVLLCASGAGFYGNRGDEVLTETSKRGTGFLSDLCGEWEAAAGAAGAMGVRVVSLRTGMVLGQEGGAFPLLHRAFSFGGGGRLGDGRQWMPWIHLQDQARLMLACLEKGEVSGAVNHVAPGELTNRDFTAKLAARLKRPAFFHAPAFALRLLLRQMADEMLLGSQRVKPQRAEDLGFTFRFPDLDSALGALVS
jgi:uncharacterized protein (TIGR01777 family)